VGLLDKLRRFGWPAAEHVQGDDAPAEVKVVTEKQAPPADVPGPGAGPAEASPLSGE